MSGDQQPMAMTVCVSISFLSGDGLSGNGRVVPIDDWLTDRGLIDRVAVEAWRELADHCRGDYPEVSAGIDERLKGLAL